jgi:hypothetical protein
MTGSKSFEPQNKRISFINNKTKVFVVGEGGSTLTATRLISFS